MNHIIDDALEVGVDDGLVERAPFADDAVVERDPALGAFGDLGKSGLAVAELQRAGIDAVGDQDVEGHVGWGAIPEDGVGGGAETVEFCFEELVGMVEGLWSPDRIDQRQHAGGVIVGARAIKPECGISVPDGSRSDCHEHRMRGPSVP